MLEDPKAHWDKLPQKQKLGIGGFAVVLLFFGLLPYLGEPLGKRAHTCKVVLV
jgi:hypothetical protein